MKTPNSHYSNLLSTHSHSQTRIVVFQQHESGEKKIKGLKDYGKGVEIARVVNINDSFPELIDEPENYISADFSADLVLCFIKHPDLSEYLVRICRDKGIPVIASGTRIPGAITPFT